MSNLDQCRVHSSCPRGYLKASLQELSTRCGVPIQRSAPKKGAKTMNELCSDLKSQFGVGSPTIKCTATETTETFGMTVEYIICNLAHIETTIDPKRVSKPLLHDQKLLVVIENLLHELPPIIRHVGSENKAADFIMKGGQTLSIKTNITGTKVCPQTIGQTTRQKFMKHFSTQTIVPTPSDIKTFVTSNPGRIISEYFKHTFTCDYLLWIVNKKGHYSGLVLSQKEIMKKMLDNRQYTFTRDATTWKESSSIKYNQATIGEFQVHSNRNVMKFRFHMDKLLNTLQHDPTVYSIRDDTILRENTKSSPNRTRRTKLDLNRTFKSGH